MARLVAADKAEASWRWETYCVGDPATPKGVRRGRFCRLRASKRVTAWGRGCQQWRIDAAVDGTVSEHSRKWAERRGAESRGREGVKPSVREL